MIHHKIQEIVNRIRDVVRSQGRRFRMRVRNQFDVMVTCPTHSDETPSLHITACNDGTVLFYCFAGCKYHSIADIAGIRQGYSHCEVNGHINRHKVIGRYRRMKEVARYVYTDELNEQIFTIVRSEPKNFTTVWSSEDAKNKWQEVRPFYNMPRLAAAEEDDVIIFCEGEKDAQTLTELGCIATCTPHGASMMLSRMKWSFIHNLQCRNYLITWDYDVPGLSYAIRLLAHLTIFADSIGLIMIKAPYGADITDYRNTEGDQAAMQAINTAIQEMIRIDVNDTESIDEEIKVRNWAFMRLVPLMVTHSAHVTQSHLLTKYSTIISRVIKKYGDEMRIRILKAESDFQKLANFVQYNRKDSNAGYAEIS